jgi:GT2 family glycosyltransferase
MKLAIVLVNYNGWEDTTKCLDSLAQLQSPADIILVDNASKDRRLAEYAEKYPTVHTYQSEINGGWAGGNNLGIEIALEKHADLILLLNNDTIVAPNLVDRIIAVADANPSFGMFGPVINFMDEPDQVMTDGCNFNHPGYPGFFQRKEVKLAPSNHLEPIDIVNGCALVVCAEVIQKIGLIDEQFFLIHEESDFNLRCREAGFQCGVFGESLVWHKGSSSFKRTGSKLQRYYDSRNLVLLIDKHRNKHHTGRGNFATWATYWKYVYYRFTIERENGCLDAADAVLEGVSDAWRRRFGPRPDRKRWDVPLLRFVFKVVQGMASIRK